MENGVFEFLSRWLSISAYPGIFIAFLLLHFFEKQSGLGKALIASLNLLTAILGLLYCAQALLFWENILEIGVLPFASIFLIVGLIGLWYQGFRNSIAYSAITAFLILFAFSGYYMERYAIVISSFHRDYLESGWEAIPGEVVSFLINSPKMAIYFLLTVIIFFIHKTLIARR